MDEGLVVCRTPRLMKRNQESWQFAGERLNGGHRQQAGSGRVEQMKVSDGCLLLEMLAHFPGLGSDFPNIQFRKQKVNVVLLITKKMSNHKNIEKVFERKDNSLYVLQITNIQEVAKNQTKSGS